MDWLVARLNGQKSEDLTRSATKHNLDVDVYVPVVSFTFRRRGMRRHVLRRASMFPGYAFVTGTGAAPLLALPEVKTRAIRGASCVATVGDEIVDDVRLEEAKSLAQANELLGRYDEKPGIEKFEKGDRVLVKGDLFHGLEFEVESQRGAEVVIRKVGGSWFMGVEDVRASVENVVKRSSCLQVP